MPPAPNTLLTGFSTGWFVSSLMMSKTRSIGWPWAAASVHPVNACATGFIKRDAAGGIRGDDGVADAAQRHREPRLVAFAGGARHLFRRERHLQLARGFGARGLDRFAFVEPLAQQRRGCGQAPAHARDFTDARAPEVDGRIARERFGGGRAVVQRANHQVAEQGRGDQADGDHQEAGAREHPQRTLDEAVDFRGGQSEADRPAGDVRSAQRGVGRRAFEQHAAPCAFAHACRRVLEAAAGTLSDEARFVARARHDPPRPIDQRDHAVGRRVLAPEQIAQRLRRDLGDENRLHRAAVVQRSARQSDRHTSDRRDVRSDRRSRHGPRRRRRESASRPPADRGMA